MLELEKLKQLPIEYFNIGESYAYWLTRVKEAFAYGTVTLDDFEEFTEDSIDDIIDFIQKKMEGEKS